MDWETLTPLAPTAGALIISAVLLFLLRIPQASRTVSESYDRLIMQLHENNAHLRAEILDLRTLHEECERRSDDLERRLRAIERSRR
jgi:hypothetical protein